MAEDFLDICCDSHVKKGTRGRGNPPRLVQGWAAPPISPQHGAMSRTEWQCTKLHRRLLELSCRAERCEARGYTSYIDIQLYHQLLANCCNQVRLLQP
eukprot:6618663-Pyramimonas_sp.AAC.1